MALLRNRQVNVLGPVAPETSPVWTVQYSDGTREDTELKNIQMSDSELKEFTKNNGERLASQVHPISDKEHQEVLDNQDVKKIKEKQARGESNQQHVFVPATTYVKQADVDSSKSQGQPANAEDNHGTKQTIFPKSVKA